MMHRWCACYTHAGCVWHDLLLHTVQAVLDRQSQGSSWVEVGPVTTMESSVQHPSSSLSADRQSSSKGDDVGMLDVTELLAGELSPKKVLT